MVAEGELGAAGGGGVVLEVDGPGQERRRARARMSRRARPPSRPRARRSPRPSSRARRAWRGRPRRCARRARRAAPRRRRPRSRISATTVSRGVGVGDSRSLRPVADAADEVDEHDLEAAPPDLGAEEVGALGVERHRHERLADPAALRLPAAQQPVGLEVADDHRDRLRREPGHPRDLGLRQRPVAADEAEHQPLVLRPHPGLVRAPRQRRRRSSSRVSSVSIRIRPSSSGSGADIMPE